MSKLYFAQPMFRAASPDFKHLPDLPAQFTLDTPGGSLTVASQYYCIEAYAQKMDRDAACGMTAHPDVKYVPIAAALAEESEEIGCGYAIDHPFFEKVLDPILCRSVERLKTKIMNLSRNAEGPIETVLIARTLYMVKTIADRNHVRLEINGVAIFEKEDPTTIDATCAFLKERLHLHFLPTQPRRKAH